MTEETRGRKPKAINDIIDTEILKFRDQIVLDKNSKLNKFWITSYFYICVIYVMFILVL